MANTTTIEGWEKDKAATMVRRGQVREVCAVSCHLLSLTLLPQIKFPYVCLSCYSLFFVSLLPSGVRTLAQGGILNRSSVLDLYFGAGQVVHRAMASDTNFLTEMVSGRNFRVCAFGSAKPGILGSWPKPYLLL